MSTDSRERFEACVSVFVKSHPSPLPKLALAHAWYFYQAAEADALERAAELVTSADGEMLTHHEVAAAIRELKQ